MRKTALASAALAASLPSVLAQVSFYDVDPDLVAIYGSSRIFFDFDNRVADTINFAGNQGMLFFLGNVEGPSIILNDGWRVATANSSVARYDYGDALSFAGIGSNLGSLETSGAGNWEGDTGAETKYVALRNPGADLNAWIALRYDDAANSITLESFAVAPGSAPLAAGQTAVPEPAATAAVMALLGGGAAIWSRRRRARA